MVSKSSSLPPVQYTEHGIPIRNLWYMLLYAWNESIPVSPVTTGEVESAPTLDTLFALILTRLMLQRMRIGLRHAYVNEQKTLRGVRGRINFSESLKHHSFEQGGAECDFQQFSVNEPRNQIVRSTLVRLIQAGEFGPDKGEAEALRHRLRWLVRNLDGIDLIDLTPALINRNLLAQNDRDYRLMLSVCELILQRQMPLEAEGTHLHPSLDRDALILHRIYERFVANFYKMHLKGWKVIAQKRLEWHAEEDNEHLPSMIPDLVLEDPNGRIILLDTKFTAASLVENQWGKPIYDSSHLYQLYTYLRSQEHLSEAHRTASGILLYPAVQNKLSERVQLHEHIIRIECVDLASPWQDVEGKLLFLTEKS
jgi:5-methylcytosine-specific restriction enzyme subunit McrC